MATHHPSSLPPDVDDAREHLTALRDVEWLLALDELWTSSISASREAPNPDFAALGRLARDIDGALKDAPDVAMHVARSLEATDDDRVDSALGSLAEAIPEAASVVDWLFAESDAETSARIMLIAACRWVAGEAQTERGILREKASLLAREELPDPDVRPLFRCIWSLVGIGAIGAIAAAGAVTVLGVPAVVALGGAGYAYGVVKAWEKSGCKEAASGAADAVKEIARDVADGRARRRVQPGPPEAEGG